jgi:predicted ester cyclase
VHEQAFRTHITAGTVVYGDANAMLEARFKGTHIGEFECVPATGREVDVPYAVAYDLRGDRISALRLYFPLDLLKRQIAGAAQEAAQAV